MDRAVFTGGPAYLVHNGITLQMSDDWDIPDGMEFFEVRSNLQGYLGRGVKDLLAKITCTPIAFSGSIATMFTKLYGGLSTLKRGALVFPSVDKPAVIQTAAGQSITYASAMITKPPAITFAPDKVFFGQMELTCLLANDAEVGDDGSFVTVANSAYTEPSLNPLDILYDLYTLTYGTPDEENPSPFDEIEVGDDGIVFTPTFNLEARMRRSLTYQYRMIDQSAEISFKPENIGEADYYSRLAKYEGEGLQLGGLTSVLGDKLTIAGSAAGRPLLTIAKAYIDKGGLHFGAGGRLSQLTMKADRSYSGSLQNLWSLGVVA